MGGEVGQRRRRALLRGGELFQERAQAPRILAGSGPGRRRGEAGACQDDYGPTAGVTVRYTASVLKRVLIVEDDAEIIQVLQEFFAGLEHGHDYEIETATDGVKALPLLRHTQFDLVLLDMRMPRMDGLELLKKMHQHNIRVPVLMVTANEDAEAAGEALSAGVFAYVPKPFDLPRLEHLVALALSGGPPADDPPST